MNAPPSSAPWVSSLEQASAALRQQWTKIRRHLHQHPELSGEEVQTTKFLADELTKLNLPVRLAGEGRGVTADLVTSMEMAERPFLAIRGDIDALPINDEKRVPYRSVYPEVMHACGHDAHATIVLGAMQVLAHMHQNDELPWPIAVRAILQPDEETATGAKHMIHHHALRDISAIVALHVDPTRKVGCIGLRYGDLTAACDMFEIVFHGSGGHSARPHLTRDPIDACTLWVQSAFRRVNRSVDPHSTVVISVGSIHSGHKANIIPDVATLTGTLRSLQPESRRVALETLEDVCESVQIQSGCKVEMALGFSAPGVVNDQPMTKLLNRAAMQVIDPAAVDWIDQPSMGSEDFSYYLEHLPGAMFRLGIAGDQIGSVPLHTTCFDIDERAIEIGVKMFVATVIRFFDPASEAS